MAEKRLGTIWDIDSNCLKKIVVSQQGNFDTTSYIGTVEHRTSYNNTTPKVVGLAVVKVICYRMYKRLLLS